MLSIRKALSLTPGNTGSRHLAVRASSPAPRSRRCRTSRITLCCTALKDKIGDGQPLRTIAATAAAAMLSGAMILCPLTASAEGVLQCTSEEPVCDAAKVIPSLEEDDIATSLKHFESKNGWRIRVLTKFGAEAHPSGAEVKEMWKPDDSTVIVLLDPSSPNVLNFSSGKKVRELLSAPFFTELKSKYGNKFFVRDYGEQATVQDSVTALQTCLIGGGCDVVPGLDSDHYAFTLIMSIAGGLVFGASTRIDPKGFADRRWVSPMLLSPLWGSLLVSYGIGPVVTRTSDIEPLAGNILAFLAVGFGIYLLPLLGEKGSMGKALLTESERQGESQQETE